MNNSIELYINSQLEKINTQLEFNKLCSEIRDYYENKLKEDLGKIDLSDPDRHDKKDKLYSNSRHDCIDAVNNLANNIILQATSLTEAVAIAYEEYNLSQQAKYKINELIEKVDSIGKTDSKYLYSKLLQLNCLTSNKKKQEELEAYAAKLFIYPKSIIDMVFNESYKFFPSWDDMIKIIQTTAIGRLLTKLQRR